MAHGIRCNVPSGGFLHINEEDARSIYEQLHAHFGPKRDERRESFIRAALNGALTPSEAIRVADRTIELIDGGAKP